MDINQLVEIDHQLLLAMNGSDSLFLDALITTLTNALTWIPLYVSLLMVVIRNNENVKQILLVLFAAGLCVLLAGTVCDVFVKPSVARWRPTHNPQLCHLIDVVNGYRGGDYGFFSSHAANTFSLFVFFSLLMRQRFLTIALLVWTLTNCYTRIYLGVHYPGDVACGILWGGIVGIMVYCVFHKAYKGMRGGKYFISAKYTSTGYVVTDIDSIIATLVLTYVYAVIRACFVVM